MHDGRVKRLKPLLPKNPAQFYDGHFDKAIKEVTRHINEALTIAHEPGPYTRYAQDTARWRLVRYARVLSDLSQQLNKVVLDEELKTRKTSLLQSEAADEAAVWKRFYEKNEAQKKMVTVGIQEEEEGSEWLDKMGVAVTDALGSEVK